MIDFKGNLGSFRTHSLGKQLVTNPVTGEKELPINILLRSFDKNKEHVTPKLKRLDTFETIKLTTASAEDNASAENPFDENELHVDKDGYAVHGFSEMGLKAVQNRNEFNAKINNILEQNGIKLSKDEKFAFEVDGYFAIHVSGEDGEKAKSIENILNDNNLGYELFINIQRSPLEGCYDTFGEDKMTLFFASRSAQRYLDCELSDLIFKGNKIYTPDGISIEEAIRNSEAVKEMSSTNIYYLTIYTINKINQANKIGLEKINDISLKIDYQGGGLLDINYKYGFGEGQTEWLDKFKTLANKPDELWEHINNMLRDLGM